MIPTLPALYRTGAAADDNGTPNILKNGTALHLGALYVLHGKIQKASISKFYFTSFLKVPKCLKKRMKIYQVCFRRSANTHTTKLVKPISLLPNFPKNKGFDF